MTDAPEEKWLAHNGGLPSGNYPKDQLVRYIRADLFHAKEAENADLRRKLAEAREVKPLEWVPGIGDELIARSAYGKYAICKPWFTGRGMFWLRGIFNGNYDSLEAAKAAAQADYEARILSALKGAAK